MSLRENGIMAICTGFAIMMLGTGVMFDRAVIIAGNLIVIAGFVAVFNSQTFKLFHLEMLPGTAIFMTGIVSFFMRYAILGFLLEFVGVILLFKRSISSLRSKLMRLIFGRLYLRSNA